MRRFISAVVVFSAVVAACGGGTDVEGARNIRLLGANAMPETMLDLTVTAEDASMVKNKDDSFVEAVGLYSLRRDELLQAVFQVSRFTEAARTEDRQFRQRVIQQIGSTVPQAYRMGEQTVYLTTGRRQAVAVWFKDRDLFVLSTRDDYERPRALLREALEIEL